MICSIHVRVITIRLWVSEKPFSKLAMYVCISICILLPPKNMISFFHISNTCCTITNFFLILVVSSIVVKKIKKKANPRSSTNESTAEAIPAALEGISGCKTTKLLFKRTIEVGAFKVKGNTCIEIETCTAAGRGDSSADKINQNSKSLTTMMVDDCSQRIEREIEGMEESGMSAGMSAVTNTVKSTVVGPATSAVTESKARYET